MERRCEDFLREALLLPAAQVSPVSHPEGRHTAGRGSFSAGDFSLKYQEWPQGARWASVIVTESVLLPVRRGCCDESTLISVHLIKISGAAE